MNLNRYFLTPAQKRVEMKKLRALIKRGCIDRKMIPHLEAINKMPGLMTLFCCEGHKDDANTGHGNLLIWLSREAFERLFVGVGALTAIDNSPAFEFYHYEGGEYWCRVIFRFHYSERDQYLRGIIHILGSKLGVKKYEAINKKREKAFHRIVGRKMVSGKLGDFDEPLYFTAKELKELNAAG